MPGSLYEGPSGLNPDVVEDGYSQSSQQALPTEEKHAYGDQSPDGPWLTDDEAKVAKAVLKAWTDQDTLFTNYNAEVRVNDLRRKGYANVEAVRSADRDEVTIWNWGQVAPGINKAATYCRKFSAQLLADPPEPDPEPAGSDAVHRDQADFAKKVLDHELGEGALDATAMLWEASDLACVYRKAFGVVWVEPEGDRVPVQIEAHPQATMADQPFAGPPDPMTGQPTELDAREAILRFVRPDGSLTDEQEEAAWQWAPGLAKEVVDGRHVRTLPASAETLEDAHGALVASFLPLGTLQRMFPDVFENVPDDQVEKLKQYPAKARCLLPGETRREREALASLKGKDALIFTIRAWQRACRAYPRGAYVVVAGGDGSAKLCHRQPWEATMPGVGQESLDIPIWELRQWRSECVMDIVGPGNELRSQQLSAILDHTDKVLNQKVLLPIGSIVTDADLDADRRVLLYNPAGKPEAEQIEPLDNGVVQTFQMLETEMQNDLGLSATAQGLEGGTGSGESGRAKFAIIGQAQVALAEPRFWMQRAYTRLCRIVLQQVRAFYTVPQRLRWVSPDGGYKEERWVGADLGSTRDVRLRAGTLSMLSPLTKTEQIISLAQAGLQLPPEELHAILASNANVLVSIREDATRTRVRRQIAEWEEGPPEGWEPPKPPMGVVGVDPTGQPMMGPMGPPPPDPKLAAIWEPVPADEIPAVALVRVQEIAKSMASENYSRWPVAWRQAMDAEFQRMRMMAGVLTVPEQQQAQAQQAQAQAAKAQQDQQTQQAMRQQDMEAKMKAQQAVQQSASVAS